MAKLDMGATLEAVLADSKAHCNLQLMKGMVSGDFSVIPTGFYDIDYGLMEIGGLPRARMTEISGPESGGKSTVALRVMGNAQKLGLRCALFDVEQSYGDVMGVKWMIKQGVDPDQVIYCDSVIAEEVFDICYKLLEKRAVDVIVIDSIGQMLVEAESLAAHSRDKKKGAESVGKGNFAGSAKIITNGVKQLASPVRQANALLIGVNQIRDVIGSTTGQTTTPGGHGWHHAMAVRLRMLGTGPIREGTEIVGNKAQAYVLKSKVSASRYKKTGKDTPGDLSIYYDGRVVDELDGLIVFATKAGVVERKGSWYAYGAARAQGEAAFKEEIRAQGLKDELVAAVRGSGSEMDSSDFVLPEDMADIEAAENDQDFPTDAEVGLN